MTYTPFPVPSFGGLNLVDDPEEVGPQGSIDLMNVDLDTRGRVRSRDGYTPFTSAGSLGDFDYIAPFYTTSGTRHLIASQPSSVNGKYVAYDTTGAVVATNVVGTGGYFADSARFGGPGAEVSYVTSSTSLGSTVLTTRKWDGTTWANAVGVRIGGAGNYPYALEVQAVDNRLVGAFQASNNSRVGFSNAGVPETWGANDYVDLTPGDGEKITALVSWREFVFVFKETKFFVFTGNAVGAGGSPIFNYRPVVAGVGCVTRAAAIATPNGVYFLHRRGIYRTTGGDPVLVSRAIDPIFRGGASAAFQGGVLNHAAVAKCAFTWHDERLYFAYPSGSATDNDRMLVYDPEADTWMLWDLGAAKLTSFRVSDEASLIFSYSSTGHDIGEVMSSATTDNGVAISSRHQSGFYELAPKLEAFTRWTRVTGSGTPTLDVYTDEATSDPLSRGAAVTLGTAPAVAEGFHQKSYNGRRFSHRFSGTSPWSVSSLTHEIAHAR